ncbi:hypothetical protein BCR35DRAFT_303594, partial [Leucosporidium creatinivorum]
MRGPTRAPLPEGRMLARGPRLRKGPGSDSGMISSPLVVALREGTEGGSTEASLRAARASLTAISSISVRMGGATVAFVFLGEGPPVEPAEAAAAVTAFKRCWATSAMGRMLRGILATSCWFWRWEKKYFSVTALGSLSPRMSWSSKLA